jgi:peptide-methionine (S)-S-oxide reductase
MTEVRAVLAGGGFWGVQDRIRRYDGVLSTRVGDTGGSVSHATDRHHGSHAEAGEVIVDPARVSSRQILELFFQMHDPSTRNRQGNDVGTSDRSAIVYTSDEQKRIAEDTIADVDASGLWLGKVVVDGYHCYHSVIGQCGGAARVARDRLPDAHPAHHAEPSAAAAWAQRYCVS